jgi:hypothetical protein
LRKLEAKAGLGDLTNVHAWSDDALFAHSREVARALVVSHGSLEAAQEALKAEGHPSGAEFIAATLAATSTSEFMGTPLRSDERIRGKRCDG